MKNRFSLLELIIVVAVIAVLATIVIPNLIGAKLSGNEASALSTLKTIANAQAQYILRDRNNDGKSTYGTLDELVKAKLISLSPGGAPHFTSPPGFQSSGYVFQALPGSFEVDGDTRRWSRNNWFAQAWPIVHKKTGERSFFINQDGAIYFTISAKPEEMASGSSRSCRPADNLLPIGK